MGSFYMFLPSNVHDITERNTIGNYTTYLPQEIKLHDADWEVGLSEIFFLKTYFNVVEDEILRFINSENEYVFNTTLIPKGCYYTIDDVINKIQEVMDEFIKHEENSENELETKYSPKISYLKQDKKVAIIPGYLNSNFIIPDFSESIHHLLGIDTSYQHDFTKYHEVEDKTIKGVMIGSKDINLNAAINDLFIYCDIVKPSVVGDTYSKVLRVITLNNTDFGDQVQQIYYQPQYFPLDYKEFHSIEIDIKDDSGASLKFDSGRVIVVLHFKRK